MTDDRRYSRDRGARVWFFAVGGVGIIPESSCVKLKRHVPAIDHEVARLLPRTYRRSLRDAPRIDQH